MDEFFWSYEAALSYLDKLTWSLKDAFGGLLLFLLAAMAARLVFRAILTSLVGKTAASVCSGVAEIFVGALLAVKISANPGVLFTAMGWSAAVFSKLFSKF